MNWRIWDSVGDAPRNMASGIACFFLANHLGKQAFFHPTLWRDLIHSSGQKNKYHVCGFKSPNRLFAYSCLLVGQSLLLSSPQDCWLKPPTVGTDVSHMGVSINGGTPKWMVYSGTSYSNGWFCHIMPFDLLHQNPGGDLQGHHPRETAGSGGGTGRIWWIILTIGLGCWFLWDFPGCNRIYGMVWYGMLCHVMWCYVVWLNVMLECNYVLMSCHVT